MYIRNYGLRKRWLDKFLKNPSSEDRLTGNMVNGPTNRLNFNDRTFTILIDHCEGN